jgi:dihydrodipicolinate synthase/N-acetylneuraminate lyase
MAVGVAQGRVPVVAGAGSNATSHAIELARDAEAAGADAVLSVVPYYNKPMQAGIYAHFHAIGEATGLPVILYDAPSRTVCGLADDTLARLAEANGSRRERAADAYARLLAARGLVSLATGLLRMVARAYRAGNLDLGQVECSVRISAKLRGCACRLVGTKAVSAADRTASKLAPLV